MSFSSYLNEIEMTKASFNGSKVAPFELAHHFAVRKCVDTCKGSGRIDEKLLSCCSCTGSIQRYVYALAVHGTAKVMQKKEQQTFGNDMSKEVGGEGGG